MKRTVLFLLVALITPLSIAPSLAGQQADAKPVEITVSEMPSEVYNNGVYLGYTPVTVKLTPGDLLRFSEHDLVYCYQNEKKLSFSIQKKKETKIFRVNGDPFGFTYGTSGGVPDAMAGKPVQYVSVRGKMNEKRWNILSSFNGIRSISFSHDAMITEKEIKKWISGFESLRFLSLPNSNCSADALKRLSSISSLRSLHLNNAEVSDKGFQHFKKRSGLRELSLHGTDVTGTGLKPLKKLPLLHYLNIGWNHKIKAEGLQVLKEFPSLRSLHMAHAHTSFAKPERVPGKYKFLKHLTDLVELDISNWKLTDSDLDWINSTGLKSLRLSSSKVTGDGLKKLKSFPRLEVLDLRETEIKNEDLKQLKTLTSLRDVKLKNTQITGKGLKHLNKINSLEVLNLANTKIKDGELKELQSFDSLWKVSLKETAITNDGVKHLVPLKKLRALNISGTNVTLKGLEPLLSNDTLVSGKIKAGPEGGNFWISLGISTEICSDFLRFWKTHRKSMTEIQKDAPTVCYYFTHTSKFYRNGGWQGYEWLKAIKPSVSNRPALWRELVKTHISRIDLEKIKGEKKKTVLRWNRTSKLNISRSSEEFKSFLARTNKKISSDQELSKEDLRTARKWIHQLKEKAYRKRKEAMKKLLSMGTQVYPVLYTHRNMKNAEARERIHQLLKKLALKFLSDQFRLEEKQR